MKIAGKVTVCGIDGTVAFTGLLATENKLVDWNFTGSATAGAQQDGLGGFITVSTSGKIHSASITIVPFDPASPGALATAKSKVVLPEELSKVIIAAPGLPIHGDWHYARAGGGNIQPDSSGQALKVTIPLERFEPTGGGAPAYLGDAVTI